MPDGVTTTSRFQSILRAADVDYPDIPINGITFAQCLAGLPLLSQQNELAGLPTQFVRGRCELEVWGGDEWRTELTVTFHPSSLIDTILSGIKIQPAFINQMEFHGEARLGMHVQFHSDYINGYSGMPLPPAAMIDTNEWRMWAVTPPLNEFGYFYAALFLAGNYARYYPDKWLYDVERSSPLSLAIEELCAAAEWRVPWLALSELGMTLLVNEA